MPDVQSEWKDCRCRAKMLGEGLSGGLYSRGARWLWRQRRVERASAKLWYYGGFVLKDAVGRNVMEA